jgi:membrane associated rhomboid family serine protease
MATMWQRYWVSGTALTRLITANVLVWLFIVTLSVIGKLFIPELRPYAAHGFFLSTYAEPAMLVRRPWTIITHMFAHAGLFHILFNMLLLYYLGSIFQGFFGQRKLLATYLMGGLVGFLAFFLLYNGSGQLNPVGKTALGASAAVMAIFVATATYFPDMTLRLFLFGNVKLKVLALVYVVLDFVALNGMSNVGGHAGHLGGALYGFLLMTMIRKGTDLNSGMERLIDWGTRVFSGKRQGMKVAWKRSPQQSAQKRKSDAEFNREKKERQERIDAILDKISRAGYDSLTKDEKDYLFRHGQDI